MERFEILVVSVEDKEHVVAEIWFKEIFICQISNENNNVEVEFHNLKKAKFAYESFVEILNSAKRKLQEEDRISD